MNKGQATLEFSLVLIITIVLIGGFIGITTWVVGHLVPRQDQYEFDRVGAGTKATAGLPEIGYHTSLYADDQVYYLRK